MFDGGTFPINRPGGDPHDDPRDDPRFRPAIACGFVITDMEGRAWLKRVYHIDLKPDHSQDLTILMYLTDHFDASGDPYYVKIAPNQDERWVNFMIVTGRVRGTFLNLRSGETEEVLQDDLKDILKYGEREAKACKVISKDLGGWTQCKLRPVINGPLLSGIETTDFKRFFSLR